MRAKTSAARPSAKAASARARPAAALGASPPSAIISPANAIVTSCRRASDAPSPFR